MRRLGLVLLAILWCAPALGAEPVVVAVDHFPPWKLVRDGEVVGGIDIEILDAILGRLGLAASYEAVPWKRALRMLESGSADMVTGILKRPERESYAHFVGPYKTKSAKAFYQRLGEVWPVERYEDLFLLRACLQLGARHFAPFDGDPRIIKHPVSDLRQCFPMLDAHRVDVVIGTETNVDYLLLQNGLTYSVAKAEYRYVGEVPVYFALSRKSPFTKDLPRLREIVKQLREEDFFQRAIARYFRWSAEPRTPLE